MGKGLIRKLSGKEDIEQKPVESETYIDLGSLVPDEEVVPGGYKKVKVAELHRYEDIHEYIKIVYSGDILLLDISPLASDEFTLRRVYGELKTVARDVNGDVAGVSKHLLMVTPTGVKIDRKVIRGT